MKSVSGPQEEEDPEHTVLEENPPYKDATMGLTKEDDFVLIVTDLTWPSSLCLTSSMTPTGHISMGNMFIAHENQITDLEISGFV